MSELPALPNLSNVERYSVTTPSNLILQFTTYLISEAA
jgi:hypothetical protein